MLGVLITLLFSAGAGCLGHLLVRKLTASLDPALRLGVSGMVGLGAIGTLTLFIGLAPGGLSTAGTWIVVFVVAAAVALTARSIDYRVPLQKAKGGELLFALAIGVGVMFAVVSVLAPSDTIEWDSLAYHLAVPKLWLAAGQIQPISFIHHSNFPFTVDNLYIWGLGWGGQSGAKAFTLAFHIYGLFSVFGFTRERYGRNAAWWATLAWEAVPLVMWLSGTAYIDVQNGLYAGLGILFAATLVRPGIPKDPKGPAQCSTTDEAWLGSIMLGLAAGSKYTGLQTILAVGAVLLGVTIFRKQTARLSVKALGITCVFAVLIASPWYLKNVLWVGNPVYPFFYKQFGGKNWSDWNARIYSDEQQSFGVARTNPPSGSLEPQRLGHAILGLAYQPGRYINPGQTSGQGFPIGSIGFVALAALALWLFSGRAGPFEGTVLGIVLVSFAMWFVLSEQSRYIIALAVPLSVLAGGAVTRLRTGAVLAGAIVVQALVSLYVIKTLRFDDQAQVALGKVSQSDYQATHIAFYEPAQYLNDNVKSGRVALYDEVFGFLLNVPYFWANPGHTTELGYDAMGTGEDLARALAEKGITYVYVNLHPAGSDLSSPQMQRWIATFGLNGSPQPYSAEEKAALMPDFNWRAKVLLGEAAAQGYLAPEKAFGSRVIFRLQPDPSLK